MSSIQAGSGYIIGNTYNTEQGGSYQLNGRTVIDSNINITINSLNTQNNSINAGTGTLSVGSIIATQITSSNISFLGSQNLVTNSINTQNNSINTGSGNIYTNIISSGIISSGIINTQNNYINVGSGTIYASNIIASNLNISNVIISNSINTGTITSCNIITQNNSINAGTGSITATMYNIGVGGSIIYNGTTFIDYNLNITSSSITTQNNIINAGSGTLFAGNTSVGNITSKSINTQNYSLNVGSGGVIAGLTYLNSNLAINIPINTSKNALDVNGAVAIGSVYAGFSNAQSNSLIISGNVGIGTANPLSNLHVNGTFGVTNGTSNLLSVNSNQTLFGFNSLSIPYITVSNLSVLNQFNITNINTQNNSINAGSGTITSGSIQTSNIYMPIGVFVTSNIQTTSITASNMTVLGSFITVNSVFTETSNFVINYLTVPGNSTDPAFTIYKNGGSILKVFDCNVSTITSVFSISSGGTGIPSGATQSELINIYELPFVDTNRNLTTTTINTQNNSINAGTGTISAGTINATSTISTQAINTNAITTQTINSGSIVTNSIYTSSGTITTQNNSINAGTGSFTVSNIYAQNITTTSNVNINGNLTVTSNINILGTYFIGQDSSTVRTALQLSSANQVFLISKSSQKSFVIQYPSTGQYISYASNCLVYQNGVKLAYYNTNKYDYTLTSNFSNLNPSGGAITTFFTINLTNAALNGDVVDITIYPSFYNVSNINSYPPGYIYQVYSNTLWRQYANNITAYTLGNVGIGTTLPVNTLDIAGGIAINGNNFVDIGRNITAFSVITSNLTILGSNLILNTITTETSNFSICNVNGNGPALSVTQKGSGIGTFPIADFYDYNISTTIPAFRITDSVTNPSALLQVGGVSGLSNFLDTSLNITTAMINTQNNNINTGSGSISCCNITVGGTLTAGNIYIGGNTPTFQTSLQVNPISQVFIITSSKQKTFTLSGSNSGLYSAYASNCAIYQNGIKLAYSSSNVTDYNISFSNNIINYVNQNISQVYSTYTVTLTNAALNGDVIDITVWPSLVSTCNATIQRGMIYQTFNYSNTVWSSCNNNAILSSGIGNVGIGTSIPNTLLQVNGTITTSNLYGIISTQQQSNINYIGTAGSSLYLNNIQNPLIISNTLSAETGALTTSSTLFTYYTPYAFNIIQNPLFMCTTAPGAGVTYTLDIRINNITIYTVLPTISGSSTYTTNNGTLKPTPIQISSLSQITYLITNISGSGNMTGLKTVIYVN